MKIPIAPKLPFALESNCTLTFAVNVGGTVRNPQTGKRTQQTKTIAAEAFLKSPKNDPSLNQIPGSAIQETQLEGYLLASSDVEILPNSVAKIVRRDLPERVMTGEFTVVSIGHPHHAQITSIGLPIRGSFRETGGGVPDREVNP